MSDKRFRSPSSKEDFGDEVEFDKSNRSVRDQLRKITRGKIDVDDLDDLDDLEFGD